MARLLLSPQTMGRSVPSVLAAVLITLHPVSASAESAQAPCSAAVVEVFPGTEAEPAAQYLVLKMDSYPIAIGCQYAHIVGLDPDYSSHVLASLPSTPDLYGPNATVLVAMQAAADLFGLTSDAQPYATLPYPDGSVRIEPAAGVENGVRYGCFAGANAPALKRGCAIRNVNGQWVLGNPQPVNHAGQVGTSLDTCDLSDAASTDCDAGAAGAGSGGAAGSGGNGSGGDAGKPLLGGSGGAAGSTPDSSVALDAQDEGDAPQSVTDADVPAQASPAPSNDGGCATRAGSVDARASLGALVLLLALRRSRRRRVEARA
jgi:hypothetical protein